VLTPQSAHARIDLEVYGQAYPYFGRDFCKGFGIFPIPHQGTKPISGQFLQFLRQGRGEKQYRGSDPCIP
jgi:hypothetical protein